ncbi:MAG: hypothetical protein WD403_11175 [Pirellulales bacterium]
MLWPQFLYAVEFVAGPFDGHKHVSEQPPCEWAAMVGVPIMESSAPDERIRSQPDRWSGCRHPIRGTLALWRRLCRFIRGRQDRRPRLLSGKIALYELEANGGAWCYRYLSATSADHLREIQLLHESR